MFLITMFFTTFFNLVKDYEIEEEYQDFEEEPLEQFIS